MTGLKWFCGDFRTGRIFTEIPISGCSWSIPMDDAGQMSITVPMRNDQVQELNLRSATAKGKCFLAYAYVDALGNEFFLDGGQIWTRSYDDDSGILTIGANGFWSYFDRRKTMNAGIVSGSTTIAATAPITYSGWTLGTIASKVTQYLFTRAGSPTCVVFPADIAGPVDDAHTRTYNAWDLGWWGDGLRALTQVIGGPEIAFRPRRKASDPRFLEWVMLTGNDVDPFLHQSGADWIWDGSLPKSGVSKIGVTEDGTNLGDGAWAKGNGSEAAALMSFALGTLLTDLGYPYLDTEVTGHDSVEVQATLDGYTTQSLGNSEMPTETVPFTVERDASPTLGMYAVGDYSRLVIPSGHPYFPAGPVRSRITQLSGDDGTKVNIQVMPTPGSL